MIFQENVSPRKVLKEIAQIQYTLLFPKTSNSSIFPASFCQYSYNLLSAASGGSAKLRLTRGTQGKVSASAANRFLVQT